MITPLRLFRTLSDLRRDEAGSTLVEFGIVAAIFLFIIFGLIDFGRLGFAYVMAEKATQRAVRTAVVSAPACPGLPKLNTRNILSALGQTVKNGTSCSAIAGLCVDPGTVSCLGNSGNPTAAAIWAEVRPLLPGNARISHLRFAYGQDPGMGFLGGAYSPVVTVELRDLPFDFISPLGALATAAGAEQHDDLGTSFTFPTMSSSLPSEDLR